MEAGSAVELRRAAPLSALRSKRDGASACGPSLPVRAERPGSVIVPASTISLPQRGCSPCLRRLTGRSAIVWLMLTKASAGSALEEAAQQRWQVRNEDSILC